MDIRRILVGNYLNDADIKRIVLREFGAALPVPAGLADRCRSPALAALMDDAAGMREVYKALGYMAPDAAWVTAAPQLDRIRLPSVVRTPGT